MAGKISNFIREFQLIFSIILTIVGAIVLFFGIICTFFTDNAKEIFNLTDDFIDWNIYMLIAGFIVFAFGAWYLYVFVKNKRFIAEELETKKRSEFLKKHSELKKIVKHMPSKYHKMLKEKEEELKVK